MESSQNSNLSKISCLAWWPASLTKSRWKMKDVSCLQDFSHYNSMGKFFHAQGRVTLKWIVWSVQKSNSSKIVCLSRLPVSLRKIQYKMKVLSCLRFPHHKSMGAFGCHGNQSFDLIYPKTLCSIFPTQMMLHTKFEQDLPSGLKELFMFESVDDRHTIDLSNL